MVSVASQVDLVCRLLNSKLITNEQAVIMLNNRKDWAFMGSKELSAGARIIKLWNYIDNLHVSKLEIEIVESEIV